VLQKLLATVSVDLAREIDRRVKPYTERLTGTQFGTHIILLLKMKINQKENDEEE
jgi:hypothetical protein